MRRLAVLLLVVIVAVGMPAGMIAQDQDAPSGSDTEEPVRPSDYTRPGYYPIDDNELNFRYFDGQEWSGPVVGSQVVGLYASMQLSRAGRETVELLAILLGGGGDGLYLALIVAALLGLGEAMAVDEPPTPAPSPIPSPSPLVAVGPGAATSLSPNYRFVWNWGSTIAGFDGTVTGGAGGWVYTGESISSWPKVLHIGGGTARCTFQGDPEAPMPEEGWPMDCDIYWQEDATWTGQIQGLFYPDHDDDGNLVDFAFKGVGDGTAGDDWSRIEILLEPCEPLAVC